MVSKFRTLLNQSFCLVMVDGKWSVAKVSGDNIFLTHANGSVQNICTTDDMGRYKRFTESLEHETSETKEYVCGDILVVGGDAYYVVDAGFRGDDGNVKYMIAR